MENKKTLSEYISWLDSMTDKELVKTFPEIFLPFKDECSNAGHPFVNEALLWRMARDYNKTLIYVDKPKLEIDKIAIFSNNDEEGSEIIDFFIKNGAKNVWQHTGKYRRFYHVEYLPHIKGCAIYNFTDSNSVEKYGYKRYTLSELAGYEILNRYKDSAE
jgi:hypothetical protein